MQQNNNQNLQAQEETYSTSWQKKGYKAGTTIGLVIGIANRNPNDNIMDQVKKIGSTQLGFGYIGYASGCALGYLVDKCTGGRHQQNLQNRRAQEGGGHLHRD